MMVLHHEWGALHIGHRMEESPEWDHLDAFFNTKFLSFMMLNRGFYPVFHTWLEDRRAEFDTLITIFDGHATHKKPGGWMMCADGEYDKSVQQFVDDHDGKAMLILLLCCNPENRGRITSKKSLVVYSRSAMTLRSMESGRSRQLLHIPGHGDFIGTTDKAKLNEIAREFGYEPSIA